MPDTNTQPHAYPPTPEAAGVPTSFDPATIPEAPQQAPPKYANWRETNLVDLSKDYPTDVYLFEYLNRPFAPLGNIVKIQAQAKSGKTFYSSIIMAAALHGECLGIRCRQSCNVIYFDTEQSISDTVTVGRRTNRLACRDALNQSEDFLTINLRQESVTDRWPFIQYVCRDNTNPTLIVIDGTKDLVKSILNEEENNLLIDSIMKLSTELNACIVNIIHENHGDTMKARGFTGTELTNKCADGMQLTRDKDKFTAKNIEARGHAPIENFEFRINDEGLPESYITIESPGYKAMTKGTATVPNASASATIYGKPDPDNPVDLTNQELFELIFSNRKEYQWTDLLKTVKDLLKVGEKRAKDRIDEAKEHGILLRSDGARAVWRLAGDDATEQLEMPFSAPDPSDGGEVPY